MAADFRSMRTDQNLSAIMGLRSCANVRSRWAGSSASSPRLIRALVSK